jgi:hypothetical protein
MLIGGLVMGGTGPACMLLANFARDDACRGQDDDFRCETLSALLVSGATGKKLKS